MKNRIRTTALGATAAVVAAAALAGPASAAPANGPATATTDAGTSCTTDAAGQNRGGLLTKRIDFSGDITCTLADPANSAVSSGVLALQSPAPLGIGMAGGTPRDPAAQEVVPPPPPPPGAPQEQGPSYECDTDPGVDCGFAGSSKLVLPGNTYTVYFGTTLTAPEGETWTSVAEGCEISEDPAVAFCSSQESIAVR